MSSASGVLGRIHHRRPHDTWIGRGNRRQGCCELFPVARPEVWSCGSSNDKSVVLDGHIYDKDGPRFTDAHVIFASAKRPGFVVLRH